MKLRSRECPISIPVPTRAQLAQRARRFMERESRDAKTAILLRKRQEHRRALPWEIITSSNSRDERKRKPAHEEQSPPNRTQRPLPQHVEQLEDCSAAETTRIFKWDGTSNLKLHSLQGEDLLLLDRTGFVDKFMAVGSEKVKPRVMIMARDDIRKRWRAVKVPSYGSQSQAMRQD